jgi:hypothetical protein
MMQKGRCPKGRSCTAAHTIYEYWLVRRNMTFQMTWALLQTVYLCLAQQLSAETAMCWR